MSKKGRDINQDELSLWDRFIDGINPLKNREVKPPSTTIKQVENRTHRSLEFIPSSALSPSPVKPDAGNNTLDRRTMDKLRKGKMKIEGKIDLHNKTQDQAYSALQGFITRAFQHNKRCVLVVTGKGTNTKADEIGFSSNYDGVGILKSRLPDWINQPPLNQMVLRYVTANRQHGGDGAFYLYLKKQRPD